MADSESADAAESPHIITNVSETAEENNAKQENEENEAMGKLLGFQESQASAPSVLVASRLKSPDLIVAKSSNEAVGRSMSKGSSAVLRPSQQNGNAGTNPSPQKTPAFLLNPSRLNPFAKVSNDERENGNERGKWESCPAALAHSSNSVPKFLPLLQNGNNTVEPVGTTATTTSSISSSAGFVFGQNIQDRVVSESKTEDSKLANCTDSNGTSDMLFSSVLKETPVRVDGSTTATTTTTTVAPSCPSSKSQCTKSLSESAREYEESRAVKRKYEEVEVKTGEEGETNVLQVTCKLFAFDKNGGGSWQERGRGILRLNDLELDSWGNSHSRLVFRSAGSLRVVLNTKIWAEMTVQQASNKSIRLTAFDSKGEIKVFLLTGSPEDVKQLQRHLEARVKKELEKQAVPKAPSSSSSPPPLLRRECIGTGLQRGAGGDDYDNDFTITKN